MKGMKYIIRIVGALITALFGVSCSQLEGTGENVSGTYAYRMKFECDIEGSDYVATKAGYAWEDGTVIHVQFTSKKVKGLATYNAATDEWVVETEKALSVVDKSQCEVYWFNGLQDASGDIITIGPDVSSFKDIDASYSLFDGGLLVISAKLTPMTSRLRFLGEPGRTFTVDGLRYCSEYSFTSNVFTRVSEKITVEIGPEGSSNYYYVIFADSKSRTLTIEGEYNTAYVRSFPEEVLVVGTSGYMTVPTFENLGKWTLVNPDNSKEIFVPQVSETIVSNVKGSAATLQAQVLAEGNGMLLSTGFVYGTAASPTLETSASYSFEPTVNLSVRIGGLDKTTTYYVRAYASNPRGLVYGPESSFTTTDESDGISSDGYDDDDEEDWNTEGNAGEGDDVVKDDWSGDSDWGSGEDSTEGDEIGKDNWSGDSDWGSGEDSTEGDEIGKDNWSDESDWGSGEDSAEGDEIVKDVWPEDEDWGTGEDSADDGSIGKDDWADNEDWNDEEWTEEDTL